MPKVSLITLCYNQLENATKPFLESLYKYTNSDLFELIIVNNASSDGTKEFLDEFKETKNNVVVIHNDENFGYAKGNNVGLKVAKGDFIFLLNNDLLFTPNWLEKFVELLKNNSEIGIISCRTNYAEQKQQLVENYKELNPKNYLEKFPPQKENTYEYIEGERVVFFCVGMTRATFEKVGYLDEKFGLAWCEDDDYTLRTIMSGLKVAVAKNIFIYHNHSQTTSKLVKDGKAKEMIEKNRKYFEEKHSVYIALKKQAEDNIKAKIETLEKKHKKYKKLFNIFLPLVLAEFIIIVLLVVLYIVRAGV